MTTHTNYKPGKPGLYDAKIHAAKSRQVVRNGLKAMPETAVFTVIANLQRSKLRYSDKGDFTTAYRGGFY